MEEPNLDQEARDVELYGAVCCLKGVVEEPDGGWCALAEAFLPECHGGDNQSRLDCLAYACEETVTAFRAGKIREHPLKYLRGVLAKTPVAPPKALKPTPPPEQKFHRAAPGYIAEYQAQYGQSPASPPPEQTAPLDWTTTLASIAKLEEQESLTQRARREEREKQARSDEKGRQAKERWEAHRASH